MPHLRNYANTERSTQGATTMLQMRQTIQSGPQIHSVHGDLLQMPRRSSLTHLSPTSGQSRKLTKSSHLNNYGCNFEPIRRRITSKGHYLCQQQMQLHTSYRESNFGQSRHSTTTSHMGATRLSSRCELHNYQLREQAATQTWSSPNSKR